MQIKTCKAQTLEEGFQMELMQTIFSSLENLRPETSSNWSEVTKTKLKQSSVSSDSQDFI